MTRAAFILAIAACGAPARLEEPAVRPAPYCFSILANRDEVHFGRACLDSIDLCRFARNRAIAFAEVAQFVAIGACRVEGP